MKIDLNADLGEGCASDSALLQLVSSANIACGFHAGDAVLMQQCVREALKNGVAIGAHPSFPDRENFGRTAMQLPPETVYARCCTKLARWRQSYTPVGRAAARQTAWHVVQPCGERAAFGRRYRSCGARCRRRPGAGWAGGQRAYPRRTALSVDDAPGKSSPIAAIRPTAALVPRSQPGALIESEEQALAQTLEMVQHNRVRSLSGEWAHVKAETVCLHGDGAHALDFARRLRAAFAGRNIDVSADLE